jgi:demethylmenaquinone methyltransferase / 2-methoxy-6-polyprenyl-1,4-benzoquinol methylase
MSSMTPLPGTRPPGARDEREASRSVRDLFGRIAPRYDLLNHLLSLSFDRVWRERTARRFRETLSHSEREVLDVCCGTGDLAFAMRRVAGQSGAKISASDFAPPMLRIARLKAQRAGSPVHFFAADSLALPFADEEFDLVTAAFGFRNLANYEAGLRELARVLRRGGEVAILEFCEPRSGIFAALYRFYFRRILPILGGVVSGKKEDYSYLPASVASFPPPERLSAMMREAGFGEVRFELWEFGIVALHTGRRV